MKSFLLLPVITLIAAINFSAVNASIVASFDFAGGSTASTDTSTFSIASAYDPSGGGNLDGAGSNVSSSTFQAFIRSSLTSNSTDPTSSDAYHSFNIEVTGLGAGQTLDLTSFEFDYFNSGFTSDQIFAGVYSNLVGFTGVDDRLSTNTSINANNDGGNPVAWSIGLTPATAAGAPNFTGTEFVGLSNGDIAEFRIYFGDQVNQSGDIQRIDNLVLNGNVVTVAIPEPTSIALFGLGSVAMLVRRRRK